MSLKMLLHVFIYLDSILLVKALSGNIFSRGMELCVEIIEKSFEIVLKFEHVVGGNHVGASFVDYFM